MNDGRTADGLAICSKIALPDLPNFKSSHPLLRDFLLALALANFSLIQNWILLTGPTYRYFFPDRTALVLHFVTLLVSILFGAIALAATLRAGTSRFLWIRMFAAGCISIAFSAGVWPLILTSLPSLQGWRGYPLFGIAFASLMTLFAICWMISPILRKFGYVFTLVVAVLSPLQMFQLYSIWRSLPETTAEHVQGQIVEQTVNSGHVRGSAYPIIWILADELDQHLTFEASVPVPHFDQLRRSSIEATAVTPAEYQTAAAIPAMLTGRHFTIENATANWHPEWVKTTLIHEWAILGRGTTVIGWYHPYCSLFGQEVDFCFSVQSRMGVVSQTLAHRSLIPDVLAAMRDFFVTTPPFLEIVEEARRRWHGDKLPTSYATDHRKKYERLHEELSEAIARKSGFTFIHIPLPHPPGISGPGSDYIDNLQLADLELGYIRELIERAGVWDQAVVVVSGDHHYRIRSWGSQVSSRVRTLLNNREDPRTVLLLKLPGQQKAIVYSKPLNAVLMHDLLTTIAARSTVDPLEVVAWLDANRGRGWINK